MSRSTSKVNQSGKARAASVGAAKKVSLLPEGFPELRWLVVAVVVLFALGSAIVFGRLFQPRPVTAVTAPENLPAVSPVASAVAGSAGAQAVVQGESVQATSVQGESVQAAPVQPVLKMNLTPASEITPEQIDRVAGGAEAPFIYFKDGSAMSVDPTSFSQLRDEIRLRFSYSRGGPSDAR